ncbi:MAG: hypothetical protein VKI82_13995 [Leptolyngbya sp.]|nr:hypothetical protein [Leptolyngbya sp.]
MTGSGFQGLGFEQGAAPGDDWGGLSMVDMLSLPLEQRQLMVWLVRQSAATLADMAQQFEISEAEAQQQLAPLLAQGYVQAVMPPQDDAWRGETTSSGAPALQYHARISSRQRATSVDASGTGVTAPLAVMLSGARLVAPGAAITLSVTVTNKGNTSAVIDVFLEDLPASLYAWVSSTQERLALGPDQSREAVFTFLVPATAMAGYYTYALVVDAPQHYPSSPPQRFEQRIQVLPAAENADQASDPTFFLLPPTRSDSPVSLSPGDTLELQVLVHNRAQRVDRFRLRCLDLPSEWLRITYPQGFQAVGLSLTDPHLDLNPNDQGTILVVLTVPLNTLAGSYVGTLQLQSENQPDLVLLELLYLEVRPVYQVGLSFRTLVSRVQHQAGVYMVQASNQGNTPRSLRFQALPLDGGDLCTFTLEPPELCLAPQQTQTAQLTVQPRPRRKRPWIGGGRVINFAVEPQDPAGHPLPDIPMQGFLLWEARPWWQLLPLVLLVIGGVATVIWLVWWLWLRPPVPPQVVRLAPADPQYSEANDDAVRLDFQVSQPRRVQRLELVGQSPEGTILSGPLTYDLRQGLPADLEPFCTLSRVLLTCRAVLTDARRPGQYQFTLTAFPKPGRGRLTSHALTSALIAVDPFPQPEILAFDPSQPVYPEAPPAAQASNPGASSAGDPNVEADPYGIRLNWAIAYPQRIAALELVGRDPEGTIVFPAVQIDLRQGLPEALQPFCKLEDLLVCENLQTGVRQAGRYIFELTVIPVDGPADPPITLATAPILIEARPPQILSFLVNGQPTQSNYTIPLLPGQQPPQLVVSWQVEANPGTTVALLPVPGNVPPQGSLPIPLSPETSSTVITLQVTNRDGQQVQRSFTLATVALPPASAAGSGGANGAADGGAAAAAAAAEPGDPLVTPRPSSPNGLSPSELPPQFE